LISFRLISKDNIEINSDYIINKIKESDKRRLAVFPDRLCYRLVNSESDLLPGLIIDRFQDNFSFQIFSAGMENFKNDIISFLNRHYNANSVIEKNNNNLRILEGLENLETVHINKTDLNEFLVNIDDINYSVNLIQGQKTGFYLDQSLNRKYLRNFIKPNQNILDLFCNEGGFALNASLACSDCKITAVDSSDYAISKAIKNSELNNFKNINFICKDVFEFLKDDDNIYDVIILDPPSFTKSKKTIESAAKGYEQLNSDCLSKLKSGGLLFTFSCSHHISAERFLNIISKSSAKSNRQIQIIHFSDCSYDHPVLPQMPETKYLKEFIIRVIQ